MRKLLDGAHVLFVATMSIMAFVAVLIFLQMFGKPLWSGEAAGWTQAIGAILAIWGAFAIAGHQQRIAEKRERETAARLHTEKCAAVALVVKHACALVLGIPGQRSSRGDYEMHLKVVRRTAFENVRAMLSTAPIFEVQDQRLVAQILVALDMVDGTISLLAKIDAMPATERIAYWHSLARWIEDQRRNARGILDNLQAAGMS